MLFNIWNPARLSDLEIRFDVTRANAPSIQSGDPAWIRACLDSLGVHADAREWSIVPGRCYYYSDYTDQPDWRDRWPITWTVRVTLNGTAPRDFPSPSPNPPVVDQRDTTWEYGDGDDDPAHDNLAWLLVLLRGTPEETRGLRDRSLQFLPAVGTSTTSVEAAGPNSTWLRITVSSPALFPDHAAQLEEFLEMCKGLNLVVNFAQLYHQKY